MEFGLSKTRLMFLITRYLLNVMNYCKIGSSWREITAGYKRENGEWVVLTDTELRNYLEGKVAFYSHHESSLVVHTLMIGGSSTAIGENCNYTAVYDGSVVTNGVAWSVVSGSSFVTISQSGEMTILPGASEEEVVVEAAVDSLEALEAPIDTAHVM